MTWRRVEGVLQWLACLVLDYCLDRRKGVYSKIATDLRVGGLKVLLHSVFDNEVFFRYTSLVPTLVRGQGLQGVWEQGYRCTYYGYMCKSDEICHKSQVIHTCMVLLAWILDNDIVTEIVPGLSFMLLSQPVQHYAAMLAEEVAWHILYQKKSWCFAL